MAAAPLFALMSLFAPAAREGAEPVELGTVTWEREPDAAFARARASGRPVFLLFQEVPG